jgi:hypothetical protein
MFISGQDPKFYTREDNAIIALLVKIGLLTPQKLILRSSEGLKRTRFGRKELNPRTPTSSSSSTISKERLEKND